MEMCARPGGVPSMSRGLLVDYLEHERTFGTSALTPVLIRTLMTSRSSSGRCAPSRHLTEGHPQVLVVLTPERRRVERGSIFPIQWLRVPGGPDQDCVVQGSVWTLVGRRRRSWHGNGNHPPRTVGREITVRSVTRWTRSDLSWLVGWAAMAGRLATASTLVVSMARDLARKSTGSSGLRWNLN